MPSVTVVDHDAKMELASAPATPGNHPDDEPAEFWTTSEADIVGDNAGREGPMLTPLQSQTLQSDIDAIIALSEESTRRVSDGSSVSDEDSFGAQYHGETRKSVFLLVPPMVNKQGSTKSSGSGETLKGMASRRHIGPRRELERVRNLVVVP